MMEDNGYVTVGLSLPQCEDDEILSRRPVAVHDQVVRDDQGRIRFHGAFTGGFSAGYFNSVDTKEGWVPKTFKSSRSSRHKNQNSQKPEDFMDNEDFGEYGIAPKKLSASNRYQGSSKQSWKPSHDNTLLSLFSNSHLQHCIEPAKLTVGQKLLKKLGWKATNVCTETECDDSFGCALPPELLAKEISKSFPPNIQSDVVHPIDFSFQNNHFGLGYKGLSHQSVKKSSEMSSMQNTIRGIKGQAFGIGALEEDDDDIYAGDSTSNYNTILYMEEEEPALSPVKTTCVKRDKEAMDGFKKSSEIPIRIETYPAPIIPGNFTSMHSSSKVKLLSNSGSNINKQKPENNFKPKTNFKRGEILGEKPQIGSVFELLSEKDKLRIERAKMNFEFSKSGDSEETKSSATSKNINEQKESIQDSSSKISSISNNVTGTEENENMTEWEKEQKKDISMANHLSIDFMMGRFVRESGIDAPIEKELSVKEKAASKNMFGHLTREIVTWHPAKLLCVRFNIEDPYPESSIVGLLTQKHSKLSIFDVLTRSNLIVPAEPQPQNSEPAPKITTKSEKTTSKPLAILASVDLRPASEETSVLNLIPADSYNCTDDAKVDLEKRPSTTNTSEEIAEVPAPSIDIFKAIFEDEDDDDEEEEEHSEKDEPKHTATSYMSETKQTPHQSMDILPDVKWNDQSTTGSYLTSLSDLKEEKDKKKKKEHKHKKHKHSHKSKKSKSKKEKHHESDESSNDSYSDLSREDRRLLAKKLKSLQTTKKA